MEEPTIVESKRQKKVPPPRPPPPTSRTKANLQPADPRPRSQTVSGDMPQRPKYPPVYPTRYGGSPMLEKKSAADPVPPPRRRKKQQLIFPENNPNGDVKEGFINAKQEPTSFLSKNDVVDGERPVSVEDELETKEESAGSLRSSSKRKEAQNVAKMKVGVLA